MAVANVVFNGTRLNSSDSNTGWGNYNTGGGAPASEAANAYQQDTPGSSVGAVGKKVNSTNASSRIGVDYLGSAVDYSGVNMWFCKVYVSDSFDLNTTWGVEVAMGSGNGSNFYQYNLAGSGANNDQYLTYPSQGGYILAAISPNVLLWAEAQSGTLNQTAVIWYAVGATFIGGFAKSENVAMDAIDYGEGLIVTRGDGAGPVAAFIDFLDFDQNTKSNRYGVVSGSVNSMQARGKLAVGDRNSLVPTVFISGNTIVTFLDGYVDTNQQGVEVFLNDALDDITITNTIIGGGRLYGLFDTRPDFKVSGTAGILRSSSNLRNHNEITYTSACDIDGADIECKTLINAGEIQNTIIRTDAVTPGPTLNNTVPAAFGPTRIHDCEFIQSGSFHAMRFSAGNTYNLTNITFTNYGANGTTTSAIQILSTTGTVTINVNGGNTPTYTSSGATVVINNTKTVKVTVLDAATLLPIQGARVLAEAASGGALPVGTDILSGLTDINGEILDPSFNYTVNQPITGRVRKSTSPPLYKEGSITGTITVNGFDSTILLVSDE
tara:strand:- start:2407 stop:4059 length:1653 start_codon:yes stop_codon:yes gene_type:complete